jgi:hypothetical protein
MLLPDDPSVDARGSPDGRAVGNAMVYNGSKEWAIFEPGSRRIQLTEGNTKYALDRFKVFISKQGSCKCKEYFFLP